METVVTIVTILIRRPNPTSASSGIFNLPRQSVMLSPSNDSASFAAQLARQHNQSTRGAPICGPHRARITELIQSAFNQCAPDMPKNATVIGPGNCHDLDLQQLMGSCSLIQLLDIDRETVNEAVQQVSTSTHNSGGKDPCEVRVHAPVDFAWPLIEWSAEKLRARPIDELIHQLKSPLKNQESAGAMDSTSVVISTCVISQIINAISKLAGDAAALTVPLLQAVRRSHLHRMVELLVPGGVGILVSDFVSSDTVLQLASVSDSQMPGLIVQCLQTSNFFSGLHPGIAHQDAQALAATGQIHQIQMHPPWRWQLGPRVFAVFAVSFQKNHPSN